MRLGPDEVAECLNCGATGSGSFCASCGQERDIHGQTFKEYLVDISYDFLSIDGKIWRAFVDLMVYPGRLTRDYLEGKRASRPVPSRLFLVICVVVFGIAPFVFDKVGMTDAVESSVSMDVLELVTSLSYKSGLPFTMTPAIREALIERASLAALISVIPLTIVLILYRRPSTAMFNTHVAHAFHITGATLVLGLIGQFSLWYVTPAAIAAIWYAIQGYRSESVNNRRKVRRLGYWWLGGWLFSVLWIVLVVVVLRFSVDGASMDVDGSTPAGIIALTPMSIMISSMILLFGFGAELFYVTRSVMSISNVSMSSALFQGSVAVVVLVFVRGVLVLATAYWL
ncbi:MAG: DUF3667 domain-containing protein [Ignavibacteria bacterium]|nr:DUF3667 domain-containing protein [Ignavibacteria bacterium]